MYKPLQRELPGARFYERAGGRMLTDGDCTMTPAQLAAWEGMCRDGSINLEGEDYANELTRRTRLLRGSV